jgi:DNA-binding FadR family transcriptional regulator
MHLSILVRSNELEIDDMTSTRQIIENPAAGLAATTRSKLDLDRLRARIPDDPEARTSSKGKRTPSVVDGQMIV